MAQDAAALPEQKKKGTPISLRVKLLIGFTLAMAILFAGISYFFVRIATQVAEDQLHQDLENTLRGAAAGIDGDEMAELYQDLSDNEACESGEGYYPVEDERYIRHAEWLADVKLVEERAFAYTYVLGDKPNEMIFIGSGGAVVDPPEGAPFCFSLIAGNIEPPRQGLEDFSPDYEGYTDEFGSWISGYMPIRNSDGDVVGAVGADFPTSVVDEARAKAIQALIPLFLVSYALLFVVVWLVSGFFTRPISALTTAAARIGEGDYETDLSQLTNQTFPDEIGSLANVFEIMVGKVYQREQSLKERVQQLEIMVDEAKRDKQVSEIVDSDFFNELTAKAAELRKRARGGGAGGGST